MTRRFLGAPVYVNISASCYSVALMRFANSCMPSSPAGSQPQHPIHTGHGNAPIHSPCSPLRHSKSFWRKVLVYLLISPQSRPIHYPMSRLRFIHPPPYLLMLFYASPGSIADSRRRACRPSVRTAVTAGSGRHRYSTHDWHLSSISCGPFCPGGVPTRAPRSWRSMANDALPVD